MSIGTILSSLLAIVISLAFVAALAWGSLWLLKRFQDGSFGKFSGGDGGRSLRFEKALPIGPRERLVLVEVDGEQILLGVTAHAITTIRSWPTCPGDEPSAVSVAGTQERADATPRFRLRIAEEEHEP